MTILEAVLLFLVGVYIYKDYWQSITIQNLKHERPVIIASFVKEIAEVHRIHIKWRDALQNATYQYYSSRAAIYAAIANEYKDVSVDFCQYSPIAMSALEDKLTEAYRKYEAALSSLDAGFQPTIANINHEYKQLIVQINGTGSEHGRTEQDKAGQAGEVRTGESA